jgi:prefoldin subunit 5
MYEDYYIKKQKKEVIRQENERKNFLRKEIEKMQSELREL